MKYMPTVHCPRCRREFSAMLSQCPYCGNRRTLATDKEFTKPTEEPREPVREEPVTPEAVVSAPSPRPGWQTALGVSLITLGLLAACFCVLLLHADSAWPRPTPTPVPTETPEPTPPPTPTIRSLQLYHLDRELSEGFTAYVGDAPLTITVASDPVVRNAHFSWSLSDPEAASLAVSGDSTSCEFIALKPAGKVTLTVSCYGVEYAIPVYLWNR